MIHACRQGQKMFQFDVRPPVDRSKPPTWEFFTIPKARDQFRWPQIVPRGDAPDPGSN
jgi:hypothetical protein